MANVNPLNTFFSSEGYDRGTTAGVHVKTVCGQLEGNRSKGEYGGGGNVATIGMCVEGEGRGRSLGLLSVNSVYD